MLLFRKVCFLFSIIFLAIFFFATSISAKENEWEEGALTPPPPIEMSKDYESNNFFSLSSLLISNAYSNVTRSDNIVRVSKKRR